MATRHTIKRLLLSKWDQLTAGEQTLFDNLIDLGVIGSRFNPRAIDYQRIPSVSMEVNARTAFLEAASLKERLTAILLRLTARPTCHCGRAVTFDDRRCNYNTFCSKACAHKSDEFVARRQETMIRRYGRAHALQLEPFKEKRRQTLADKIG